ncbi:carboxypeptidase Ss1 [Branchiibius hedensis]|uniref:Carboxypeptidase Ss1. Metallo peptidase. MEROPS family M20D n=1 Tax=Branchiibius hedensis TaxID=672460 RepID=A0A2Y8ZU83_9MICO|nr:amidohydrolase [Branchiibius hedensis]PWJ25034.1 carboxypeptidase Ss1 [Branchiibius hedensis]SSA33849.1 carboxypeptidase Ss1. Metallo peptidase. MEROPS family M20D [Branchiibius hedensis]
MPALETRAALDKAAAAIHPDQVSWRHHLHQNPELSNREANTADFIVAKLAAFGIEEVHQGIAGHGVVAILRGGLPGSGVAGLRADIDALPVKETSGVDFASTVVDENYPGGPFPVAHACGHDCHTATLLAAAQVLASVKDQLPGTVMFIFQPAEEGPPPDETGGAQAMVDAGAFTSASPTMVFGMHVAPIPLGTVGVHVGNSYAASCLVKVRVQGQQVHASTPWYGIDPYPVAAQIISGSAQIYRQIPATNPVTVSFGHLEDVGRFNIIGDHVLLWGTIRCLDDGDMATAQDHLRVLVQNTAAAYGATATVDYLQDIPPVNNTPDWVSKVRPVIEQVIGAERVFDSPAVLGYDDMSVFVREFGGAYFNYGVQDTHLVGNSVAPVEGGRGMAMNHNPEFYADDDSLLDYLRIFVHVAYEHLLDLAQH